MGLFGIAETIGELEKALNATGRNLDQVRDLPFTTLKAARPEEGSVYVYLTPDAVEPDPDDLVNKVRAALALGALAIVTDQPVGDIDGVAVPQIVVSDAQAAIDDVITRCVAAKNAVIVGVMGTDEVQMTADMIATSTGAA